MTALATTDDVAAVAQPVPTADVARVTRLLELVSDRVRRYCGQTFDHVAADVVTLTPHDGDLRLPQRPVNSVASIVINGATIDPALYTPHANGIVRRTSPAAAGIDSQFGFFGSSWPSGGEWPWPPLATTVTYDHGYSPGAMPGDVVTVVAEVAAEKWLGGLRSAEHKIGEAIDGYSESWFRKPLDKEWSAEHQAILDSYRRSHFASIRLT